MLFEANNDFICIESICHILGQMEINSEALDELQENAIILIFMKFMLI